MVIHRCRGQPRQGRLKHQDRERKQKDTGKNFFGHHMKTVIRGQRVEKRGSGFSSRFFGCSIQINFEKQERPDTFERIIDSGRSACAGFRMSAKTLWRIELYRCDILNYEIGEVAAQR